MAEKLENPFSELSAAMFPTQAQQAAKKRARNDARPNTSSNARPNAQPDARHDFLKGARAAQKISPSRQQALQLAKKNEIAQNELYDEEQALFLAALGKVETLPQRAATKGNESLALALKKLPPATEKNNIKTASTAPSTASALPTSNDAKTSAHSLLAAQALKEATEEISSEALLFEELKDVTPLQGKIRIQAPPVPVILPLPDESNPLQDLIDGKIDFTMSGSDECLEGHVLGLDLLTVAKLQQRYYSPEAHIDLHGLNSQQAFQNIIGFFRNAYLGGKRTVLVVTGRGLNSPDGNSVLREKVQEWFTHEPLRRVILAFCTAKQEDGGTGALYVLLRKYKKKQGKVQWDRFPTDPDLYRLLL